MLQDYEEYDGVGLAALVRERQADPAELVEAAIERIEARNPRLNAVVHTMYDRARAASRRVLEGPFAGVPFLLKDLLAPLADEPATASSKFLAEHRSDHDGELVCRYKRAGLIFVGMTNTPEFGIMPVTEPAFRGPTVNPWDFNHTPGGSSGGAAAAVAAGFVPVAHGNDGGGSIRIPASCCGLFGLKPSRGRTPSDPGLAGSWGGFVQDHVLSRSVRDSAVMLDATHGPVPGGPFHVPPAERPFGEEVGRDPGCLRIAYTAQSLFGSSTHPDCLAALQDAVQLCTSLGHHVEEARPRIDQAELVRTYLMMNAVDIAQAVEGAGRATGRAPTPEGFEPQTWFLALIGRRATAQTYATAIDTSYRSAREMARFLADYDLFLTPTLAHPPVAIGSFDLTASEALQLAILRRYPVKALLDKALDELSKEAFEATANTMLFNITGFPAASVPLFWNAAGLPVGVQFVARFGDEASLFRLAGQLEQARPWFDRRPRGLD